MCTTRNVVFCLYCKRCEERGELTLSKNIERAFTKDGYNNWKKAKSRFEAHQSSEGHREAVFKMKRCGVPGVDAQIIAN